MNIYYVYALLDPLKPGDYNYDYLEFKFEPFYIGYGKNNRIYQHFNKRELSRKSHKSSKIKNIISNGLTPVSFKIKEDLSFEDANSLEIEYIRIIGRIDLNIGPLCNHTCGGGGTKNRIVSNATRMKMSMSKFGKRLSGDTKIRISKSSIGRQISNETKDKLSKNHTGENNPFYGKSHDKKSFMNQSKVVQQIDINNILIMEFESLEQAKRITGINHISDVCNNKRISAGGYFWKYKDIVISKKINTINSFKPVSIYQLDRNYNLIKQFDSVQSASNELMITRSNISLCLTGKKRTAGGYIWRYV